MADLGQVRVLGPSIRSDLVASWYNQIMGSGRYKNQNSFLDSALAAGKLSHAYLFCGSDTDAIISFADNFAKKLLDQGSSHAGNSKINPDLIRISGDSLKIENMRALIADLYLKPYQSDRKVAIIENFESATPEAASSILKTLEEPSPSTIIILLAKNRQALLPTIVSRCQVVYFSGSAHKGSDNRLSKIADGTDAEKLMAVKDFSEMESAELQILFEDWLFTERIEMLEGRPKKFSNVQALMQSISGLQSNLNKKMVLERLFLSCS